MCKNIYKSPPGWGTGQVTFMVVRQLDIEDFSEQMIEIKLLDNPKYYSVSLNKYGYAKIRLKSLKGCKIIIDKRDIEEIVKQHIS